MWANLGIQVSTLLVLKQRLSRGEGGQKWTTDKILLSPGPPLIATSDHPGFRKQGGNKDSGNVKIGPNGHFN
jgi:hypothetical protein